MHMHQDVRGNFGHPLPIGIGWSNFVDNTRGALALLAHSLLILSLFYLILNPSLVYVWSYFVGNHDLFHVLNGRVIGYTVLIRHLVLTNFTCQVGWDKTINQRRSPYNQDTPKWTCTSLINGPMGYWSQLAYPCLAPYKYGVPPFITETHLKLARVPLLSLCFQDWDSKVYTYIPFPQIRAMSSIMYSQLGGTTAVQGRQC